MAFTRPFVAVEIDGVVGEIDKASRAAIVERTELAVAAGYASPHPGAESTTRGVRKANVAPGTAVFLSSAGILASR
jgi:hypothetical protein